MGINSVPCGFLLIATALLLLVGFPSGSVKSVSANLGGPGYTAYARFVLRRSSSLVGITAQATVESPTVTRPDDYSYGGIGLVSTNGNNNITAFMDTGYAVFPAKYGNNTQRFFVRYGNLAPDGTVTGCFDEDCPGFVKTETEGILGSPLDDESGFLRASRRVELSIQQDSATQNWVVTFEGIEIGYWPNALFTGVSPSGFAAQLGGTVYDATNNTSPSSQMGSGLPGLLTTELVASVTEVVLEEAGGRITRLEGQGVQSTNIAGVSTNPTCYTLNFSFSSRLLSTTSAIFFYGGPGCLL